MPINVDTIVAVAVPAMLFLLFVAVGLDLTIEDFLQLRQRPALVLTGLLTPPLALPIIGLTLTRAFAMDAGTTLGVMIIAAAPAGGISITYSHMARASPALAVTLTTLSCLLAPMTIPLAGLVFRLMAGHAGAFPVPLLTLAAQITVVVSLPVIFGVWLRRRSADTARIWSGRLQRTAFSGVAVVLVLMVLDDPASFLVAFTTTSGLAAAFVAASAAAGWLLASAVTSDRRDRFTLASEFGARNVGVAMAIAVTFADSAAAAQFAVTYFLIEIPVMVTVVTAYRYRVDPSAA